MADRRRKPGRNAPVAPATLFYIEFATSSPATFGRPQCLPVHLFATHDFLLSSSRAIEIFRLT